MKIVKETPRKILRYLMFRRKNNIKGKYVISETSDKDIIDFFEQQKGFTSWDEFEIKWDIGIGDDIVAQSNRQEKWFLFEKDKTEIVSRPKDYWEKEAVRKGTSTHALFLQECRYRGISMGEFFKLFF